VTASLPDPAHRNEEAVNAVDQLQALRDRVIPMLEHVRAQYADRVPEGYPVLVDSVRRGVVGIELDSSYALYFTHDGTGVFADFYFRSHRIDARTSASREKFAGRPFDDHRPLSPTVTDVELRNMIAELMNRWNMQPGVIHVTDT
jgi:hypothetical protein